MKIKKGQKFMCTQTYIMDEGWVAYTQGNEYISEIDGCLTDDENDLYHRMVIDADFNEHFELIDL